MLVGSLAALPAIAGASSGTGSMKATTTSEIAGSTGVKMTFVYSAPKTNKTSGVVLLKVPTGWTAPTSKAGAGHVVILRQTCATATLETFSPAKRIVPVKIACNATKTFTLTYSGVAVAQKAASYTFGATLKAATYKPLTSSPRVTVGPAALATLTVTPANASTQTDYTDGLGTDDYTSRSGYPDYYAAYRATGFDKYGNPIGNVTSHTTFSVGETDPEAPCSGDNCQAFQSGPLNVFAVDGAAKGQAVITGDPSLDLFSCRGLNFDVNDNESDGCEVTQTSTSTTQSTADSLGMISCNGVNTVSASGDIVSDGRVHQEPSVVGFDTQTGSTPIWFSIDATGGTFCEDTLNLKLQVSGSRIPSCYQFSVMTDKEMYTAQTDATGAASIVEPSSGQYNDNSTILLDVQRTCTLTQGSDNVTIAISGDIG